MHRICAPEPQRGQPLVCFHDVQKRLVFRFAEQCLRAAHPQSIGLGVKIYRAAIGVHRPFVAAAYLAMVISPGLTVDAQFVHLGRTVVHVYIDQSFFQLRRGQPVNPDFVGLLAQIPVDLQFEGQFDQLQA